MDYEGLGRREYSNVLNICSLNHGIHKFSQNNILTLIKLLQKYASKQVFVYIIYFIFRGGNKIINGKIYAAFHFLLNIVLDLINYTFSFPESLI